MVTFVALSFLSFPHFVFSHLTYVQIKSNQITLWLIVYYSVFFFNPHTFWNTASHWPLCVPLPPPPQSEGKKWKYKHGEHGCLLSYRKHWTLKWTPFDLKNVEPGMTNSSWILTPPGMICVGCCVLQLVCFKWPHIVPYAIRQRGKGASKWTRNVLATQI